MLPQRNAGHAVGLPNTWKIRHQKNKEQTIFPGAKPLILWSDIFLIVYVIFCFIFTQLDCTRLRKKAKKERWYLARKENSCLWHQCSPCQSCCTSITKGDCIWIILGVFRQYSKHCRHFQTLKERVSLSRVCCASLVDLVIDRALGQRGSLM